MVTGHAIRLEQALVNLLDNAVKFNKPGGEVRIDATAGKDGRIVISVSDTGSRHSFCRCAADLRAFLSRGQRTLARRGRHGPGTLNRQTRGGAHGWSHQR